MDFSIRKLNPSDYEDVLVGWWKDWGWQAPAKDFLPENGEGGLMVMLDDKPVCAGFMYVTNSQVSWVDWIISDNKIEDKALRHEAVKFLITVLTNICQDNGSKYIYALLRHEGLTKTYEELGYIKGDSYTHEMIKKI
tara:strand:+ start:133 stop:543 length:411 start_codon:yes stop_codon:yes gene_type:complete